MWGGGAGRGGLLAGRGEMKGSAERRRGTGTVVQDVQYVTLPSLVSS